MLASQPLGIVASPQHPLTRERGIPAAALADCKFIVRETGSGTRAAMDRFFHEAHIAPRYHMEIGSNESIKQAVIANMGLSFLSLQTARLELRDSLLGGARRGRSAADTCLARGACGSGSSRPRRRIAAALHSEIW